MKSKSFMEALLKAKKQLQPKPKQTHQHKEDDLQQVCVEWFRLAYPKYRKIFFHVPNGGKRDAREAERLKKQGVVAGVADLFLDVARHDYHGLRIELKVGKNKQSQHQKEYQRDVEEQGYKYIVVKSIEEFQKTIDWYLKDKDM